MSNDNNLNNDNNLEYNHKKDSYNKMSQDSDGYQRNEETGEYRYSKKIDNNYNSGEDNSYNNSYSYDGSHYNNRNQHNPGDGKKKPSKGKEAFRFVLKGITFGLIVAVTFLASNEIFYAINPEGGNRGGFISGNNDEKFTIEQTKTIEDNIADTDVTQVVNATMPSVVTITGTFTETYEFFGQKYDEEKQSGGSGIIIDKNDTELLIATNNHVVEGAKPVIVTFIDGESSEAIIKGTDSDADLAVITVDLTGLSEETKDAIKIAKIRTDGNVDVGEKVVAIGNALGIGQSVTVGYVSAVDREVDLGNNVMTLLQTDAAINPGNSGGALLNMEGEVIGINTVKFAADAVEGMGYAIPIYRAMPILNELKSREVIPEAEKGYLGVYIEDVTEDIAERFNWPVGVYVRQITEGSPAEEAGILSGDIIIGLNEIETTSSTQLTEKVMSYRAGTEVTIRLMRKQGNAYKELELQVTLASRPLSQ